MVARRCRDSPEEFCVHISNNYDDNCKCRAHSNFEYYFKIAKINFHVWVEVEPTRQS